MSRSSFKTKTIPTKSSLGLWALLNHWSNTIKEGAMNTTTKCSGLMIGLTIAQRTSMNWKANFIPRSFCFRLPGRSLRKKTKVLPGSCLKSSTKASQNSFLTMHLASLMKLETKLLIRWLKTSLNFYVDDWTIFTQKMSILESNTLRRRKKVIKNLCLKMELQQVTKWTKDRPKLKIALIVVISLQKFMRKTVLFKTLKMVLDVIKRDKMPKASKIHTINLNLLKNPMKKRAT